MSSLSVIIQLLRFLDFTFPAFLAAFRAAASSMACVLDNFGVFAALTLFRTFDNISFAASSALMAPWSRWEVMNLLCIAWWKSRWGKWVGGVFAAKIRQWTMSSCILPETAWTFSACGWEELPVVSRVEMWLKKLRLVLAFGPAWAEDSKSGWEPSSQWWDSNWGEEGEGTKTNPTHTHLEILLSSWGSRL